ncbi:MAG: general stress protein CsbD [Bacteroidales bacterium]|jgi:hypothetical protein|nr:general stress protein CsbD [Bacteroidales bacterium]
MDLLINKSNWKELQSKLSLRYPDLTENDLSFIDGKEQDMLRMIEYKLGMSKQEMSNILAELGFEVSENKTLT